MFLVIKLGNDFKSLGSISVQGPWNGTSSDVVGRSGEKTVNIDVDESFAEAHLNDGRQARTEKQEKNESLLNKH